MKQHPEADPEQGCAEGQDFGTTVVKPVAQPADHRVLQGIHQAQQQKDRAESGHGLLHGHRIEVGGVQVDGQASEGQREGHGAVGGQAAEI